MNRQRAFPGGEVVYSFAEHLIENAFLFLLTVVLQTPALLQIRILHTVRAFDIRRLEDRITQDIPTNGKAYTPRPRKYQVL